MDKQTESRRQFEGWWEKCWCGDSPASNWNQLWGCDGYIDEEINGQWEAWKASRAAIVVELPEKVMVEDEFDNGHNCAIDYCTDAIRAIGIKVKGDKP